MSLLDKIFGAFGYTKEQAGQAPAASSLDGIDFHSNKALAADVLSKAYAALYDDPQTLELAAQKAAEELMPTTLHKAVPFDDVKAEQFQYKDFDDRLMLDQLYSSDMRPSGISNETIRLLSFRSTLLSSIIQRRVWQMQTFASPQKSRYDLGFKIETKDGTPPSRRQQEDIARLTQAVEELGFLGYDPIRGSFKDFVRLITQDSLQFDGAAVERIWSKSGIPVAFRAIDGGCIYPRFNQDTREFEYVEMINGVEANRFDSKHCIYYVRNKTTDRRWLGFGISEVERLINTITCHLYAEEYNKRLFKSGHFLNGVVSLKGNISRSQFQEFKRDFYSFVTGVENTNRVAIVNAPQGIEFNNAIRSPQEMGFTNFMDYLVKVASAVFLMDPVELNFFVTGGTNQTSTNVNLSSQEFRLKYSKDAGLRPLLDTIADLMNRGFVSLVSPDLELVFRGLDEDDKKARQEYLIKAKKYMTLNEIRVEEGLPRIADDDLGNIIEDSGYVQVLMNKMQQRSQAEQDQAQPQEEGQEQNVDQEQANIIEAYMKDNGFDSASIETVLDAFNSSAISFDDFKEYTGATDETLAKYKQAEPGAPVEEAANQDEAQDNLNEDEPSNQEEAQENLNEEDSNTDPVESQP